MVFLSRNLDVSRPLINSEVDFWSVNHMVGKLVKLEIDDLIINEGLT